MTKVILQHLGHPATIKIDESEWKEYSKHTSVKIAIKKMDKSQSHQEWGQWDDHYRIIDQTGKVLDSHDIEEARYQIYRKGLVY